jgi:hypothetical protein
MRYVYLALLLSVVAAAQVKTSNGVAVILGRVQSADLKYSGLGKQTGRSYSGVVRIKVLKVLDEISLAPAIVIRQDDSIQVHIEEGNKTPGWELRTGRAFVLGLQPLSTGDLKSLFAIAAEASTDPPQPGFAECVEKAGFSRDETGTPIWLNSAGLPEWAVRAHPMEMPGLMDGHAKGLITLVVLVSETGKIECAQFVDGHPLFSATAIDAATKYRFRPYVVRGRDSPVFGTLVLDYDYHRGRP